MEVLKGKSVAEGIAIGRICIFDKEDGGKRENIGAFEREIGDVEEEINGDELVLLLADDLTADDFAHGNLTSGNLTLDNLTSCETVTMDKFKIIAVVTSHGSADSHMATLARNMNIPALIEVEFADDMDNKMAVVDGCEGLFYVEPTDEVLEEFRNKQEK